MPPVPVIDPDQRQPKDIPEATSYHPSDPVWVWSTPGPIWR